MKQLIWVSPRRVAVRFHLRLGKLDVPDTPSLPPKGVVRAPFLRQLRSSLRLHRQLLTLDDGAGKELKEQRTRELPQSFHVTLEES